MASSENRTNTLKFALAGASALALGIAVYYMSREPSGAAASLDKKKYSKARLEKLLDEILLEYTCIMCRNYNLMLKVKEKLGSFPDAEMKQL